MAESKAETDAIEHYANCEGGSACECAEIARLEAGPKPEYAQPELVRDPDDDGEPAIGWLAVGWDVSFGCRMNFGPDPDGSLRVSVHVSDAAKRDGVAVTPTTPESLRLLASHLLAVADEAEWLAAHLTSPPVPTDEQVAQVRALMDADPEVQRALQQLVSPPGVPS